MAEKRKDEVQFTRLPEEQKRLEQKGLKLEPLLVKQEQSSIEREQNGRPELIERQLQEPEIQRLYAEQERLRIEAERVWLEQERHFAEQVRLRNEAESADQHQYDAEIQQLIAKQRPFEPEKQLSGKESHDEMQSAAGRQFSNDFTEPPPLAGILPKAPKQNVSSGILFKEAADLPPASPENHRIARMSSVAALIFLLFGGAVLGVWFLQSSKTEESNQTESNQTRSDETVSSSFTSSPEPTAQPTPKINKVPPSRSPLKRAAKPVTEPSVTPKPVAQPSVTQKPVTKPVSQPAATPKPVALQMKKPMPQSRKTPSKPKRPITIDDILNDQ